MRKILLLAIIATLCSCTASKPRVDYEDTVINGHSYILIRFESTSHADTWVHNPDCQCQKLTK